MPPHGASDAPALNPDTVDRFARDLNALAPSGRVLVAVSGGADSLALLLLMHALGADRCRAATVDHRLRTASAEEAAFVAGVCGRLSVPHATLTAALPARAGRTRNLSARARLLRYDLLEAHRAAIDAAWIATAHHADDQVETMVMRLNRGAGLAGLAGVRAAGGGAIRPLLGWRRDELAAIVAAAGLAPVDDPTNRDDRYDRARLRKRLADADWIDAGRWGRSAAALEEAATALDWATERLADRWCDRSRVGEALLTIADQPADLVRRLMLRCLAHVDPAVAPRGADLDRLIAAIRAGGRGTLGTVLVTADVAVGDVQVRFTLAPPRRSA